MVELIPPPVDRRCSVAGCFAHRASERMVEPNKVSLENRRGRQGASGVRIPPPPLTTRIASNDAGSSKSEAGLRPASPTA
jgi:hypothetical protein